jgi:hypothetical protein
MFPPGRGRLIDQTSCNGIGYVYEYNRDAFSSILGGYRSGRIRRNNHVHLVADQFIGQTRKSVELTLGISIIEGYISAVNVSKLAKFSLE